MQSILSYASLLRLLVAATLCEVKAISDLQRDVSSANGELRSICAALCSDRKLIMVFALHVDNKFEIALDYRWKLPQSLIYISDDDIVLGGRERERNRTLVGTRCRWRSEWIQNGTLGPEWIMWTPCERVPTCTEVPHGALASGKACASPNQRMVADRRSE